MNEIHQENVKRGNIITSILLVEHMNITMHISFSFNRLFLVYSNKTAYSSLHTNDKLKCGQVDTILTL